MGKVYFNGTEIGTFDPQTVGTSGNILIDSTVIGTFTLAISGLVYINGTVIGTYSALTISVTIPQVRVEIFRGPLFMDDNFAKSGVWTKTSGGTSSFSTDGDLVTLDAGDQTSCTIEHSISFLSTTYPHIIARITEISGGVWTVQAYYDGAWYPIISSTTTGVFEGVLPAGKTVTNLQLVIYSAGNTCKFDYIALCKDTLLVPSDSFDVINQLETTHPILERGISGARLTLPNFESEYTNEISRFDRIIIYLNRKDDSLQKDFGGKISQITYSGGQKKYFINLECSGLGEQLHAPESLITNYWSAENGRDIIKAAVAKCSELTDKFVDVDNELTSIHDLDYEEEGKAILPYSLINEMCRKATAGTLIGFDAYVDPAGNTHVFKRGKYSSVVSLTIEKYVRSIESHRLRNAITIFGAHGKPNDSSKDFGTEMATPYKGSKVDQVSASGQKNLYVTATTDFSPGDKIWIFMSPDYEENVVDTVDPGVKVVCVNNLANTYAVNTGVIVYPGWGTHSAGTTITADAGNKIIGSRSIKVSVNDGGGWGDGFYHFNEPVNFIKHLWLFMYLRVSVDAGGYVSLMDANFKQASWGNLDIRTDGDFHSEKIRGGRREEDSWGTESGFDWTQIIQVTIAFYKSVIDFWVDGMFFGDKRWEGYYEDAVSVAELGLVRCAQPQIFEELTSDAECLLKATSIIESLNQVDEGLPGTQVEGDNRFLPGYLQRTLISNDSLDEWIRIVEFRQIVKGVNWVTLLNLSNEETLIEYVFSGKPAAEVVAAARYTKERHVMRASPWI